MGTVVYWLLFLLALECKEIDRRALGSVFCGG